jgi:hypothetical protein
MPPVKMSFLRSGTKIVRSPIRKQKKAPPAEPEPFKLSTPLKGSKKKKKPLPADPKPLLTPLKGSKKRQAKKTQQADGHPDDEEAGTAGNEHLAGKTLTVEEQFWALGLGDIIRKKKGVLNLQSTRGVLRSGLGDDSLPPGLGLRSISPRPELRIGQADDSRQVGSGLSLVGVAGTAAGLLSRADTGPGSPVQLPRQGAISFVPYDRMHIAEVPQATFR